MGSSRQEYWSGEPFPSSGDLPDPGIKPRSLALQADSLRTEPTGKSKWVSREGKSLASCLGHLNSSPWPKPNRWPCGPRLYTRTQKKYYCKGLDKCPRIMKGIWKYSYLPSTNKAFDNINLLKEAGSEMMVEDKMFVTPSSPKKKYMVKCCQLRSWTHWPSW